MDPHHVCSCPNFLEPVNVILNGKRKFLNVITLRIVKWGDYLHFLVGRI